MGENQGNKENLSPAGGHGDDGSAPSRPKPIWKTATIFSNESLYDKFGPSFSQSRPQMDPSILSANGVPNAHKLNTAKGAVENAQADRLDAVSQDFRAKVEVMAGKGKVDA